MEANRTATGALRLRVARDVQHQTLPAGSTCPASSRGSPAATFESRHVTVGQAASPKPSPNRRSRERDPTGNPNASMVRV
jgi:hypothetical protein